MRKEVSEVFNNVFIIKRPKKLQSNQCLGEIKCICTEVNHARLVWSYQTCCEYNFYQVEAIKTTNHQLTEDTAD